MKQFVWIVFGDSEQFIHSMDEDKPNQGILQGNGAGLIAQVSTNASQIKVLEGRESGVKMIFFISKKKDRMVCFVFVDDLDLADRNLITDYNNIVEVAESIQNIIDTQEVPVSFQTKEDDTGERYNILASHNICEILLFRIKTSGSPT